MLKTGTIQSRTYQREDQRKWSEKSDRLKSIDEQDFHTTGIKGCKLI